jgi:predicted metal-dependent peptidase
MKDTSGSVSSKEAAAVLAIVSDAVANLHARRFVVIDVDTQVGRVEDLVPGEACQSDFVGRGGTDLRVGFNWIETHAEDAKILIVFTDGETPFPESPPPYPVVWIHFGSAPSYPFGDVVDITTLIANTQ